MDSDDPPDPRVSPPADASSAATPRFEDLYCQVAPVLFTWAELRIRPEMRRHIDPQDLVQEVWLRAVKRRSSFDPNVSSFRAWVLTIAKHVMLESFRNLRRAPMLEGDLATGTRMFVLQNCPESITSFTQRLAKDDSVRRFLDEARRLDADDQQILVRCGLEERTCGEVAREMELGEEAVTKRWQRLRAKLRGEGWAAEILGG